MNMAGGMGYQSGRQQRYDISLIETVYVHFNFSYEFDRMSNSGNARNYRDTGYQQQYPQQQQRGDNYNNQQPRRVNNFAGGNNTRGRRGAGGNVYRGGTQSDAGTGGYNDRRRQNDNESTTYDAQDMNEGQQQYNDQYPSQRYRYSGSRNNRGGGSYRYNNNNNNNSTEYYEDSYITSGQSQQITNKKSQQTSSNNGVDLNDVSTPETINGSGFKGQRTTKQQSNGVI